MQKRMTAFSLGAYLRLSVSSNLALSLPQSYCLNPKCSPTAPSSEGAEAATAAAHRCCQSVCLTSRHIFMVLCRRFNSYGKACKAALPHQNVRARRALLRFSCTRRVRFIQLCCASYAAGVLHLRRPCRLTVPTYIQSPIRFAGEPGLRVHPQSSYADGGCSHQRFCRRRYSFRPKFAPESVCAPWRFRHCA